jgi:hypothetical protein
MSGLCDNCATHNNPRDQDVACPAPALSRPIAGARREGWLGEIAGLEATLEAAKQKLQVMKQIASRHGVTHLGMPGFRDSTGRVSAPAEPSAPPPA